jgi:hypothetical protein
MFEESERLLWGFKKTYMTGFDQKNFPVKFFLNVITSLGLDPDWIRTGYSATGWIRIQQNSWI